MTQTDHGEATLTIEGGRFLNPPAEPAPRDDIKDRIGYMEAILVGTIHNQLGRLIDRMDKNPLTMKEVDMLVKLTGCIAVMRKPPKISREARLKQWQKLVAAVLRAA